jgi:hypothetical protein
MLLFHLLRIGSRTWQPDGHAVAEMEGPVVPPAEFDGPDRQGGPLRKLRRDQPAHQRSVYVLPVDRHAGRERLSAAVAFQ